jgi:hypothetical protein
MNTEHSRDGAPTAFDRAYLLALDDHNQGIARDPDEYLRLVPADERAELLSLITSTLVAREPFAATGDELAEGYRHAMAAIDAVEAQAGITGILPGVIETMGRARGIEFDQVVARLADELDIDSDEGRFALRRQFHRLRTGQLLGSRIARRVLAAIARAYDADPADFFAAARPVASAPHLSVAPAMPRAAASERVSPPLRESVAAADGEAHPDVELVNRLFCGGPDA